MQPPPFRNRHTNNSRGVRDCLDQRSAVPSPASPAGPAGRHIVGGSRLPKTHSSPDVAAGALVLPRGARGRPPRAESAGDLLRGNRPPDREGYRVPASADAFPGARAHRPIQLGDLGGYQPPISAPGDRRRGGDRGPSEALLGVTMLGATMKRDHGHQRSISCEAAEQRQAPPRLKEDGRKQGHRDAVNADTPQGRRTRSDGPVGRQPPGAAQPSSASREDRAAPMLSKFTEANPQFRDYMEDRIVSIDPFMPGEFPHERWGFFAIYDGHGGSEAADHCESQLHGVLMVELRAALREQRRPEPLNDGAMADIFTRVFHKVDDQLRSMGAFHCGATATIALVQRASGRIKVHVANAGDSRAIAIDSKGHFRLSQDHRPCDASEILRVQKEGGFISRGRVGGVLAVSRALGDHSLKSSGVTWRPSVSVRNATNDIALVIASDGLWDTLEDSDVRGIVNQCMRTEGASEHVAQRLVQDAQMRGSTDNIACVVAFL